MTKPHHQSALKLFLEPIGIQLGGKQSLDPAEPEAITAVNDSAGRAG